MSNQTPHTPLVLASTSVYRKSLLERLHLPFDCVAPQVQEDVLDGETPLQNCIRLARLKAQAVARAHPERIVIGSDQVADLDGVALSKPGDHINAVKQLQQLSGRIIIFYTAVCVTQHQSARLIEFVVPTTVQFRPLNNEEIERYLRREQPYDCAGAAKSEALGIALLNKVESTDPTALVGLPLIELCATLRTFGVEVP